MGSCDARSSITAPASRQRRRKAASTMPSQATALRKQRQLLLDAMSLTIESQTCTRHFRQSKAIHLTRELLSLVLQYEKPPARQPTPPTPSTAYGAATDIHLVMRSLDEAQQGCLVSHSRPNTMSDGGTPTSRHQAFCDMHDGDQVMKLWMTQEP